MVLVAQHGVSAQDAVLERVEANDFVRLRAGVSGGNLGRCAGGVGAGLHDGLSRMELKTIAIQPPQRHASTAALLGPAAMPGSDASWAVEVVGVVFPRRIRLTESQRRLTLPE